MIDLFERQSWKNYELETNEGFLDASVYTRPANSEETRKQLQSQHSQLQDYINNTVVSEINNIDSKTIESADENLTVTVEDNVTTLRVNVVPGQGVTKAYVDDCIQEVYDSLPNPYPVGSIYMSISDVSPATLFGGTWERIKDVFLLSAGDTYTAGSTGGEATHKLTVNEMPSHTHSISFRSSGGAGGGAWNYLDPGSGYSPSTQATGGDQPHNNMPPYLTVYMWKRVS